MVERFVVIGAGQAGGWAAKTLRQNCKQACVTLIGDEPHPPYERPPLSKEVLVHQKEPKGIFILDPDKLASLNIVQLRGSVSRVDTVQKLVVCNDGRTIPYDRLLFATGARPRKLQCPGTSLSGVFYLRTLEDSFAIAKSLQPGATIVIVGGGWIGLEVAAAARQRNLDVVLVEAADRLCTRAIPPGELSSFLYDLHRRHHVEIRFGAQVLAFEGEGQLNAVRLACGTRIEASVAVIGIGVTPNTEIAAAAGLITDDGILIDAYGRTSDSSIFAAGDCAKQNSEFVGRAVRVESWSNAQNQAIAVASNMSGKAMSYQVIPWFWSDQYGVNIQIAGVPEEYDSVVRRGEVDSAKFTYFYLSRNHVRSAVAINSGRDMRTILRIMQKKVEVRANSLADYEQPLDRLLES